MNSKRRLLAGSSEISFEWMTMKIYWIQAAENSYFTTYRFKLIAINKIFDIS